MVGRPSRGGWLHNHGAPLEPHFPLQLLNVSQQPD
jgi:hypothetical protein